MANANQLLTENVTQFQDLKAVQNQITHSQYGARHGMYIIEWSVASQLAIDSLTSPLAIGNYYLPAPQIEANANTSSNYDRFFIPTGVMIIKAVGHISESKAGSGTITPMLGSVNFGDIGNADTSSGENLFNDDFNSATDAVPDELIVETDTDFYVDVTGNTVTAGAFTIFLEYVVVNV